MMVMVSKSERLTRILLLIIYFKSLERATVVVWMISWRNLFQTSTVDQFYRDSSSSGGACAVLTRHGDV